MSDRPTSDRPSLERVLGPLQGEGEPFELSPATEARIVARLRTDVRELPRRRRQRRRLRVLTIGSSLAMLAAAGVLMLRAPASLELQIAAEGEGLAWDAAPIHGSLAVSGEGLNGVLEVPASAGARMTTPAGVRVHADASTRVRVGESARRLRLERGAVHCKVPPLGERGSFIVDAGATEVIVHGTDFSVTLRDASKPCVRVREGRVEVRAGERSVFLTPGESWGCRHELPTEVVSAPARMPTFEPPTRARRELRKPAPSTNAASELPLVSTLERENALLSEALRAERDGDHARAHTLFQSLIEHYPSSPLLPEARAGVVRNAR
jgi:hypothetical protein